jgi:threonine/homoserine/homoserine lactone efflux protein
MPDLLVPYLAVIAVLTVTPGPDMLLVLRNGIRDGSEAAWATGLGCCTGIAVHAALAVLGLSAILAASSEAFTAVKVAGAAYLVLLGLQAIRSSFGGERGTFGGERRGPDEPPRRLEPGPERTGSAFRQGLVSNLLNPKIALLFLTLLPQFVADGEPRVATTAALAAVFLAIAVLWWRAFSLAVGPLGRFLSRPGVVAWFDRGTGALLVGLGLRVALERR